MLPSGDHRGTSFANLERANRKCNSPRMVSKALTTTADPRSADAARLFHCGIRRGVRAFGENAGVRLSGEGLMHFPGWEFLPAGQKRGNLSLRTNGLDAALQGMQFRNMPTFTSFSTVVVPSSEKRPKIGPGDATI